MKPPPDFRYGSVWPHPSWDFPSTNEPWKEFSYTHRILSIKSYWLFNRDPYTGLWNNPIWLGRISSPQKYRKQLGLFSLLKWQDLGIRDDSPRIGAISGTWLAQKFSWSMVWRKILGFYTPENEEFEPKNHPIEKENHLPSNSIGSKLSIFQDVPRMFRWGRYIDVFCSKKWEVKDYFGMEGWMNRYFAGVGSGTQNQASFEGSGLGWDILGWLTKDLQKVYLDDLGGLEKWTQQQTKIFPAAKRRPDCTSTCRCHHSPFGLSHLSWESRIDS